MSPQLPPSSTQLSMATQARDEAKHTAAEKYLTFILDGGHYGIPILSVREIIAVQPITPLPRAPESVRGVINLRGKIVPVIDLRTGLGLHVSEYDRSTCIIVLDVHLHPHGPVNIGCIVDAVREVARISDQVLQAPPSIAGTVCADYIHALAKPEDDDHVTTLLCMAEVLKTLFGEVVPLVAEVDPEIVPS